MRSFAVVVIGLAAMLVASSQQPAASHQQELQRLRQSIDATRARIRDLSRRESTAMRSLTATQRQQKNLNRMIYDLSFRLRLLEDSLSSIETRIVQTRTSITNAEDRWKLLTRRMHENNVAARGSVRSSDLPAYLYAQATQSTVALRSQLTSVADSLSNRMEYLDDISQAQERSLREQQQKKNVLSQTLTRQTKEIQTVRATKQQLVEELRKKQQSAAKIRAMIEQLVAKERKQRSQQSRSKPGAPPVRRGGRESREPMVASSAPQRGPFQTKSLPWPTSGRSVLHGYGTYTNPSTGTSHENPGIDIKAQNGTSVMCVAKGQVSTVTWLPGFGSLVIVDHQNGFRTVYANLASVAVGRGSTVSQGTRIGASGSNLDGDLVHFEIWIDGKRINPLTYLR